MRKPAPRGLHSLSTHIEHVLQNPAKRRIINLSCCHSSNTFCRNLLINSSRVDLYDIQFLIPVYKAALLANLTCGGQTLTFDEDDLDVTSEYEAVDSSKEQHIEHVLMDRLEQQTVTTARLRKTAAAHTHSRLKKLIHQQLRYLNTVEVQPSPADDGAMETDAVEEGAGSQQEGLEERLQGTSKLAANMEQMCGDMLLKVKDLVKAANIYHRTEDSKFQQALCETPPSTPELSDTNCLQRSKLDRNISKKLPI